MTDTFDEIVDEAVERLKDKPLAVRIKEVDLICEDYLKEHGKKPNSYQLMKLSNVILQDVLSNPSPYKMQTEEFPILSHTQIKRRMRREFTAKYSTLDYMNYRNLSNKSTAPTKDNYV